MAVLRAYAKAIENKALATAIISWVGFDKEEIEPLKLDDLKEMDGEPVWIEYIPNPGEESQGFWALVSVDREDDEIFLLNSMGGSSSYEEVWANIRAIYRRKPEVIQHG